MTVLGYVPLGYDGITVSVEVDIRRGIPGTEIVGMAGPPVREARERVRVALKNSGYDYPRDRILVNLSPADLPKVGAGFDLAIAIAILSESGQLPGGIPGLILAVGELGLDGGLRRVPGVLAAASAAREAGVRWIVVPEANRMEAFSVFDRGLVYGSRLRQVVEDLGRAVRCPRKETAGFQATFAPRERQPTPALSIEQLSLHPRGFRTLLIAAAGRHHLLLTGPPGTGKTMLARSLPAFVPELSRSQSLEVTRIHSQAGVLEQDQPPIRWPPFRAPHPTSSPEGIVGGGSKVLPGEISLAHRGALFLDEALEFRKNVLQGLREPLERKRVSLARAGRTFWYPADFQLILACNACPCGNLGKTGGRCTCSYEEVSRYWRRLGGPLLDRIPLRLPFGGPGGEEGIAVPKTLTDAREVVMKARDARRRRAEQRRGRPHAVDALEEMCDGCRRVLARAAERMGLSRRGQAATVSVAWTIADLEGREQPIPEDLLESLAHRRFLEGPDDHPALVW